MSEDIEFDLEPEAIDPELPDGIYVRMTEKIYFAQKRVGSTNMDTLAGKSPADFWYESKHFNPDFEERDRTDELDFGKALHVGTLEGDEAYEATVIVKPATYPDAKTGKPKKWNAAANWCKDWMEGHNDPEKIILTEGMDRRCRHMTALILNHPELGESMRAGMSEVSILFTLGGVKCRARIDKLLPRFVADLKSFRGGTKGRDLVQQCLNLVDDRNMDIQRYLYSHARSLMAGFIENGQVYGATAEEIEWLTKVAAITDFRWAWIFFRKRDDKLGHAPIVQPIFRSPDDVTFKSGQTKVEAALQNYRVFMKRFGPDMPWAIVNPGYEPDDTEFSPWLSNIATPEREEDA